MGRPQAAFYCVCRRALLPRRGRDDQLAAPARPRRADLRARLRAHAKPSASCSPPCDPRRGAGRFAALAAEDGRPARPPRRGDGPDRRRHDRHPPADRADRRGRRGSGGGVRERQRSLRSPSGGSCSASGRARRGPTSPRASSVARAALRRGGARADGRPARTGSTSSAPSGGGTTTTTRSCYARPGRAQRDPRDRGRAPRGSSPSTIGWRPSPPFAGLQVVDERRAALRLRGRGGALRAPPLRRQAVARAHSTTASTRGCCGGCCAGRDLAIRVPEASFRCACDPACSPAAKRWHARPVREARALALRRPDRRCEREPSRNVTPSERIDAAFYCVSDDALLPRRGRDDQLAAAARPRASRSTCSTAG